MSTKNIGKYGLVFLLFIIVVSVVCYLDKGIKIGDDFKDTTIIEATVGEKEINLAEVKLLVETTINKDANINKLGEDQIIIRTEKLTIEETENLINKLDEVYFIANNKLEKEAKAAAEAVANNANANLSQLGQEEVQTIEQPVQQTTEIIKSNSTSTEGVHVGPSETIIEGEGTFDPNLTVQGQQPSATIQEQEQQNTTVDTQTIKPEVLAKVDNVRNLGPSQNIISILMGSVLIFAIGLIISVIYMIINYKLIGRLPVVITTIIIILLATYIAFFSTMISEATISYMILFIIISNILYSLYTMTIILENFKYNYMNVVKKVTKEEITHKVIQQSIARTSMVLFANLAIILIVGFTTAYYKDYIISNFTIPIIMSFILIEFMTIFIGIPLLNKLNRKEEIEEVKVEE